MNLPLRTFRRSPIRDRRRLLIENSGTDAQGAEDFALTGG